MIYRLKRSGFSRCSFTDSTGNFPGGSGLKAMVFRLQFSPIQPKKYAGGYSVLPFFIFKLRKMLKNFLC